MAEKKLRDKLGFDDAAIRVLMVGAARVGKTCIVASMIDDKFRQKAVDGTNLSIELGEIGDFPEIQESGKEMANFFDPKIPITGYESQGERTILSQFPLNTNPTSNQLDFSLVLKTRNTKDGYKIAFTDVPGEWIKTYNRGLDTQKKENFRRLVRQADVILITVDSVLLMEDNGISARNGNQIDSVYSLITENYDKTENPEKLIMFVPVKCEKYYNLHIDKINGSRMYDEDQMDVLMARIRKEYSQLLEWLGNADNRTNFDVGIFPVLTLGNIDFALFNYESMSDITERTAKDMLFTYHQEVNYGQASETGVNIDWSVPPHKPQFCEQPLDMILLFHLRKIAKLKESRGFFGVLFDTVYRFFARMATDNDLLSAVPQLEKNLSIPDYVSHLIQNPVTGAKINKKENK